MGDGALLSRGIRRCPGFDDPINRARMNRIRTSSTRTKETPQASLMTLTPGWKIN